MRDDILPYLGIRLEDKAKGEPSMWKFDNKEELIAARENKMAEAAKKAEAKRQREELELKKKSTSGKDWFRVFEADKYKEFDPETGLPTKTRDDNDPKKDGKPLSDAIKNKLKKI